MPKALPVTMSMTLNVRESTTLRKRFLFRLKFFRARTPSRPYSLQTYFPTGSVLAGVLISLVWRMHSITGVDTAFFAGMYAEIKMEARLIRAEAARAGRDNASVRGTWLFKMPANWADITGSISRIQPIPAKIPRGMPMMPMQIPSNNTEFRSCLAVAPTDMRIPS